MDPTEFINNLKRDKTRGVIAPHQIVLLIALFNIYLQERNSIFNIEEVNFEFQKVWKENQNKFKSTNNVIGMPLKALYNKNLIDIDVLAPINDFRQLNELKKKIGNITLRNSLIYLLQIDNLDHFLTKRFDN